MFRSILVPFDLAEPEIAQPALDAAVAFSTSANARVRLVNVQSVVPMSFMEFAPADFDAQQRSRAEESLREIAAKTRLPSDRITSVVRVGGVYPEVLAEADEWKADVIIIGSHRPAMSTYLLGSNATTIVRHATCSVLVVRSAAG